MTFSDLNKKVADIQEREKYKYVPYTASEPNIPKDIEEEVFKISFKYYDYKNCEVEGLTKSCHSKLVKWFKLIGQCKNANDLKNIAGLTYVTPIRTDDPKSKYSKLLNSIDKRITPDVDILHEKLNKSARMFYFVSNADRLFNIVHISNAHWN